MKTLLLREKKLVPVQAKSLKKNKFYFLPALQTVFLKHYFSEKEYDFCIISSANAIRSIKKWPNFKKIIVIGKATARGIPKKFQGKMKILNESSSQGLLKYFKSISDRKGKSIVFPRSRIADTETVERMRSLGFIVSVRHVYDTKILSLKAKLASVIQKKEIEAIYFTSPSSVRAFLKSSSKKQRAIWSLKYLSIGGRTSSEIRRLGLK